MPYNDKDLKKILPKSSPLEKDLKGSLEYLNSMTDGDGVNDKDKPGFDSQAFKHAIGMIESSGGKFLDSKSSSAAGKYHFLWNLIKDNESLDGMSKTEFMADDDMQEKLMDQALSGKLEGYPNYIKYATSLKERYGSDLETSQIAALTHFLGSGNVKKYLSNPDEFKVKGVNLSPEKYMAKYNQYATEYRNENPKKAALGPIDPKEDLVEQTMQPIDNTAVNSRNRMDPRIEESIQARPPAQEGTFRIEDQGEPSGLTFNNELREGGQAHVSQASDLVTQFEGGGTHEENPLGGIPQGVGANGKLNLVEEGETKWNGYIFSNAYDMEGNFTGKDGKKSNVFEDGGKLHPVDPPAPKVDPPTEEASPRKSLMSFLDTPTAGPKEEEADRFYIEKPNRPNPTRTDRLPVEKQRDKYLKYDSLALQNPTATGVDFQSLVTSEASQEFLDWNNDPITRQRLMDQGNLTSNQVDDMIIKGLKAKKEVKLRGDDHDNFPAGVVAESVSYNRGNHPDTRHMPKFVEGKGTVRTYGLGDDRVRYNVDSQDDVSVGVHERTHASTIDSAMSKATTDIVGSSWKQDKPQFSSIKEYMIQPTETYSNFVEMRKKLGMKPGEQIDEKTLIKKMKAIETDGYRDHFYNTYDNDKVIKALNTLAYQDQENSDNYTLS